MKKRGGSPGKLLEDHLEGVHQTSADRSAVGMRINWPSIWLLVQTLRRSTMTHSFLTTLEERLNAPIIK